MGDVKNLVPGRKGKRPTLAPHQRLDLQFDIAKGELTGVELAKKYDRTPAQISTFANKPENVEAIARIRSAGMDRLAGLWAADKGARVSELQDSAAKLREDRSPAGQRARQQALRNVAEELGQITQKIEGSHTVYQVDGVSPEEMR